MRRTILISAFLLLYALDIYGQDKITREQYIDLYAELAMSEMARTGIPASITLAQGCLESDNGNSRLAVEGKNHFGIKCHDWTGRKIKHDDDERNECFRKYGSDKESYMDHSEFLVTKSRYAALFNLPEDDYKAWAKGLKSAGYATSNKYADLLIQIIEENELYKYDQLVLAGEVKPGRDPRNHPLPPPGAVHEIYINNGIEYVLAQAGDTEASLRRELDLYPGEVHRYNEFEKGSPIDEGMVIYLQPKRRHAERGYDYHVVVGYETMYDISQKYGIKLKYLYKLNEGNVTGKLQKGDVVYLRKHVNEKVLFRIREENNERQDEIRMEFDG